MVLDEQVVSRYTTLAMRRLPSLFSILLACACSQIDSVPAPTEPAGPAEWNRAVTPPTDGQAAAARQACQYAPGALPAETQGASYPSGSEIPIDHILVVMMENRSFDHYYQKLPEYYQDQGLGEIEVDVAQPGFSNPDPGGVDVPIFHQENGCFVDTSHSWDGTDEQIGGGTMTGFVTSNEGEHELPMGADLTMLAGNRAMGYYDASDLPFYYWLASEFAIADRYFCSLPGPTQPNRNYLYAATSFGQVNNTLPPAGVTALIDYLELRQIDWKIYASASPGMAPFIDKVETILAHRVGIEQYFVDAEAGTLPQFAFVDPAIGLGTGEVDNNDEHPPAFEQLGQHFVAEVVQALVNSPQWSRSALFYTYDEHGGLYDHVEPPPACPPDDIAPILQSGQIDKALDHYGVRVPLVVVSPYAKKHHVSHEVYDHTSIVRFVEARFVMPALTRRDANALAPWDMFDFQSPPHLDPPAVSLPPIDQSKLDACIAALGG